MAITKPRRAQILTNDEIKELYDCPAFNANQREEYFALDDDILRLVNRLDKIETKVYLMLLIGYFRSKAVIPKFRRSTKIPAYAQLGISGALGTFPPNVTLIATDQVPQGV